MGNQIAHLDWFATSTVEMTKEGDIAMTSCSKKTLRLFHQLLPQVGEVVITHQVSFLFLPTLLHISLDPTQWTWQPV